MPVFQGTVLLIDDEEQVRTVTRDLFEAMGMSVVTAVDGCEGVRVFREKQDVVDYVLLDLTMPCMDGEECLQELLKIREDARIIISSGFSEQELQERFVGQRVAGFIQKPYGLHELLYVLRHVE